jgi:hypothetical protein
MPAIDPGLKWSLEPMDVKDQAHWRLPLPALPTVLELLDRPIAELRDLGTLAERNEDPMRLMQGRKSPVVQLGLLLKELVPMIESFRRPNSRRERWWLRFTGAALEREVTYLHACQQLENQARIANGLAQEVNGMRDGLHDEAKGVQRQAEWLGKVVEMGQATLAPSNSLARAKPCFAQQPDYWSRFARRIENLNLLHHSLLLSAEQFRLADAQAVAVLDRHADIVTVLVPLWRQRMGFELFSKTVISAKNEGINDD